MSAIWQTVVGRDDPVDGKPNQFLAVEHLFGSIEESMKELDQSFDSIRSGTSADFRGAAADAFGDKLGSISTAVGTVPIIAGQLGADLSQSPAGVGAAAGRSEQSCCPSRMQLEREAGI